MKLSLISPGRQRSYRITLREYKICRRELWQLKEDCEKYRMLVIQQQIAVDLQPHKKYSIIADSTYDSRKREATVFVTRGEPHIWRSQRWGRQLTETSF